MTAALGLLLILLLALAALAAFVQLLYLESTRLRPRERPSLAYFSEMLEAALRLRPERGAVVFAMLKHSAMLLAGVSMCGLLWDPDKPLWAVLAEAAALTLISAVFAVHLLPVVWFHRTRARWLRPLAPVLRLLAVAIRPLVAVLSFVESLVDLSQSAPAEAGNGQANEEIDAFISAGTEEGLIEEDERKLIRSVVEFGDKRVREVMTPRPNIVFIQQDSTLEELRKLLVHERYSRIPVCAGSIDRIVGFVHVRDIVEVDYRERTSRQVHEVMRKVRFVPETKPVDDLFREMQSRGEQIVMVVDEYGNTAGLATMEDVIEEILGEIRDEHEPTLDVFDEGQGTYLVSGSYDLDGLQDLVGFRPPEETESTTVGGLVTEWLGHVPAAGEVLEREGIRVEVTAANDRRVSQVRLSRLPKEEHEQASG